MNTPRRFYKAVSVEKRDGGYAVALDGRVPKTPAGKPLVVPARAIAELIAAEWDAQGEKIDPLSMPLTRLANVVIDQSDSARDGLVDEVVRYCETDLTCHLADSPQELVEKQTAGWGPVREWAGETLGVALVPVVGVIAAAQPEASLAAARQVAEEQSQWSLTALAWLTATLGSAVLALAVLKGRLTAEEAFTLSRVDEDWQISLWGEDEEASALAALRRRDALAAGQWLAALRAG